MLIFTKKKHIHHNKHRIFSSFFNMFDEIQLEFKKKRNVKEKQRNFFFRFPFRRKIFVKNNNSK